LGPVLGANALKGDIVHLLEQGVDPMLALTAGVVGLEGEKWAEELGVGDEDFLESLEDKLWDDEFIQTLSGIPCEEGK